MSNSLQFNHAKRHIKIQTCFEINDKGELVMTDGDTGDITTRLIAHQALLYLLQMGHFIDNKKPVINQDFTVEELGTNASAEKRRFRVTIKPPYVAAAITALRDGYDIEEDEIKGLERL